MSKEIFVYIDIKNNPILVGYLWSHVRNGRESATFEYDKTWLNNADRFSLDNALLVGAGSFHTPAGKALFGAMGDSAPDRWGRVLMKRAERLRAEKEHQSPKTLMEIDYLLRVDDETRQGALRFSEQPGGPFLAISQGNRIPPLVDLPKLFTAVAHLDNEEGSEADLKLLLAPGSSLGGARPKASIRDRNNHLAIAKFPHNADEINVVLWEALALTLAAKANITVPKWRIIYIKKKPVLISQRFDRVGKNRIPFLSAMSMLGANDNETHSYLEIVDALRQQGANTEKDIKALWRRVVFNIFIANTDDHLRNHAFLYEGQNGWRLAPAYDLNPVPMDIKPRILSTTIDFSDATGSIELAMSVSDHFGLTSDEAKKIILEVEQAVSKWKQEAKILGLSSTEIKRMDSAFLKASR